MSASSSEERVNPRTWWPGQGTLSFGMLGGPIAWTIHLVGVYVIAEFGCVANVDRRLIAQLTPVTWMLIATTVITALAALAAVLVAYRSYRKTRGSSDVPAETGARFSAQAGLGISGISLLVILVESIPILYYLQGC